LPLQKTEIFQTIERATRGEKWQSVEVPILCKDEKTRIALWNSANIQDRDGNIVATIAQGQDITERKKAEAELRRLATIVTDSNDAITVVDMEGRITAWNKGAEDTYGYRKDEALGMDVLKIVPEDKKQETLDVIGKIKTNETMQSFETKRLTKDGRILDVWLTATKLVDDKGNAVALATTERDITEKKRLEEKLRFSEKFTTLGKLAASVAHEIRNPLGVIKNSVYFLNIRLKEHADEKVVKHLRIMEENINAADRIISDLLDLSRNKVGALELADLNGILERAFASLSIPENIKVITKLDKIPKMLLDPERIKRVFLNIIQNAVAAMPKGGKLTVGTSRSGDSVEISFKDSGEGIPEENMQKLFTPLFTTKAKGLGMGLSICKQIIEGHRGDIVVKSKAGEGALFIVRLPILSRAELVKTGLLQADVLTGEMSK
jgi:PAS domain S-box-containing protein